MDEISAKKDETKFSVELLLAVLNQLPTPVYVKDKDTNFILSNSAHCKSMGVVEEDLLGKNDFDLHSPEAAVNFNATDRDIILTGKPVVREDTFQHIDGSLHIVLTRKARILGPDGEYLLIGTNSDLTEIKTRENQYKALSETVPVGVAQINEDLEITFANPLFNAYCGGDGTEMDHARLIHKLQDVHLGFPAEACKFETDIQGLGNQPRSFIVISSGWIDLGSAQRSATVSLIDVSQMTELRRINEDVSQLNQDLAANVRKLNLMQDALVKKGRMEQLGQLTATVAHELRNPLGAVRTSAFLLERKLKDKNLGIEAQLERINKGIVRCDNIITQLLDFSRSKQLQCQSDDLDGWLTGIVEEEVKKLPAHVTVELVLGLGGKAVAFDPSRLQRAMLNLMSNAVEAMIGNGDVPVDLAGGCCKLIVSTYEKDDFFSIRVEDNGPGMSEEILARIREPLYTTKSFGTGLGVPAIEQIAAQHGGRLDIKSEVGKGSVFTMWLPKSSAQVDTAA
jgi:PAS domain S-box-containing protein